MDYREHDNGASGNVPEFGAIFMSNIQTKKECFQRNMFALPYSRAEFVSRVKEGMVLFLFETKKRELFGVYQASSDGAVDIDPHAFTYSGLHFPAQVRFRQIWHCDPISEKEFQDAIIENYFCAKKFNFGLSKDQVRRLLYLFSSRKIKSKIPSQPLSEAIIEVALKDRRLVGNDRHELSERGYMAPTQYYDQSSLARGKEGEVSVDNRVNVEGKVYPFPDDDFLAKRRRIGKEGRLTTECVGGNALYGHGYQRTFSTGSPKDSLDEVRTLANAGMFLAVKMESEDQVNKIQNPENILDTLDVRAHGDYTSMQRSRLRDDYDMHSGRRQTFASDNYGSSVVQNNYETSDDRLLLDDCLQRDCDTNVVKSVAFSDRDLNLCRQEREMVEGQEWLIERKLDNRHHLDRDGSTVSAFDPSASHLHKIRNTTAAGRFQIDENESHFGTCSVEGFSSKTVPRLWHSGYSIIGNRKCPIMEQRSTENMVDEVPPTLATSAGYFANADRQTLDNARFKKSERVDNREASHTRTNPVMPMKYPSFSKLEQSLSSFPDKFPEKQLSRNFDFSPSIYEDATITRTVPYSPDHPNLSHGCSASKEANQNSTSVQKKHPCDGSLGNFYPLSSNMLQQYHLESEKSSRPLDTTLAYGDNGFATCTSGLRSSLLRESSNSFVNPNFSMDMDLENFEGKKGLLAYYSKSRNHNFAVDGNLPEASENHSKHVPQHGIGTLTNKYSKSSGSQDPGMDICQRETNLPIYENQSFRFSRNVNIRELHKSSGANFTLNRRSVFTRLSSKSSQFSEERNEIDVNHQDCYMDATADEVMEMLKPDDNLSLRKLGKSRVVGQPRECAIHEKNTQCHLETDHSTMEKKRLNNVTQATADSLDEIPRETRTLDFKRRSERKKNLVVMGSGSGSASHSNPTGPNEEVKSSTSSTLRRRKLVRPTFNKTDTASDAATPGNKTLQTPSPILDKDDKQSSETATSLLESEIPAPILDKDDKQRSETATSLLESEIPAPILDKDDKQRSETATSLLESENPNESTRSSNVSVEQKDVVAHVLPSSSIEHRNDDLYGFSSEVLRETSQQMISDVHSVEGILAKDTDATTITSSNLPEPSLEGLELGAGCRTNLSGEKHSKKMKIILTTKKDVTATSSQ